MPEGGSRKIKKRKSKIEKMQKSKNRNREFADFDQGKRKQGNSATALRLAAKALETFHPTEFL